MTEINYQILPNKFKEFKSFIKKNDNQPFSMFKECLFISKREDYKDNIYEEANRLLDFKNWNLEDIGTGKIMNCVSSVIKMIFNQEDDSKIDYLISGIDKSIYTDKMIQEKLFFDLFKGNISHEEAFTKLMKLDFSISLIAFLFFLIDKEKCIPFSKSYIDIAFEDIGIPHFKSNHITTWKNYESYCNIVHKVHNFLIRMDKHATLFNAYSFLWTLGLSADRKQKEEAKKIPLSEIKNEYTVDPITDLIPVCPNCHAMLHRGINPLSVKELEDTIKKMRQTKEIE